MANHLYTCRCYVLNEEKGICPNFTWINVNFSKVCLACKWLSADLKSLVWLDQSKYVTYVATVNVVLFSETDWAVNVKLQSTL